MFDLVQMFVRQALIAYGFHLGLSGEAVEAFAGAGAALAAIAWAVHKNGHWERFKTWLSKNSVV